MSKLQEQERVEDREKGRVGTWERGNNSSPHSLTYSPSQLLTPSSPSQPKIQNPNSKREMWEPTTGLAVAYAIALLAHYKFELRGYTAQELVNLWLEKYPANWVRMAVIEALYQGRYKAVSVEQFLTVWTRRGQPVYRFNREFERLISRKLPQNLTAPMDFVAADLIEEYNLLPLPPSADEIAEEQATQEERLDNPASTATQDNSSTVTTGLADLTETPFELKDQLPELRSQYTASSGYDADWSRCELKKKPIHQFTPSPDASDFFLKLKAVAQQQGSTSDKVITPLMDEEEFQLPEPDVDRT
jgi:hypothetical protein